MFERGNNFVLLLLGKVLKKNIESLNAVKPTPAPPPPIFDRLRFFFGGCFFIDTVVEYGMKQIL